MRASASMEIPGPLPDWKASFTCMRLFRSFTLTIDDNLHRRDTVGMVRRRMPHHGEVVWEIAWRDHIIALIRIKLEGFETKTKPSKPAVMAAVIVASGIPRSFECTLIQCEVTMETRRLCVGQIMTSLSDILPRKVVSQYIQSPSKRETISRQKRYSH